MLDKINKKMRSVETTGSFSSEYDKEIKAKNQIIMDTFKSLAEKSKSMLELKVEQHAGSSYKYFKFTISVEED